MRQLYIILFFFSSPYLYCQDVLPDSLISPVSSYVFDSEKLASYKASPIYNYDDDPDFEGNPISRLWSIVKRKLKEALGKDAFSALGDILYYLLIGGAMTAIIYYLVRSQSGGFWGRKEVGSPSGEVVMMPENMDFESMEMAIIEAEAKGNYRYAIRLLFLKSLKWLDNSENIDWYPEMTNSAISSAISDKELKKQYEKIRQVYEYIWYGSYPIASESRYRELKKSFIELLEIRSRV